MKRLKLRHAYHDALIREVRYHDNADVILELSLCSCCNPSPGPATLVLLGVRNFRKVHQAFESARLMNAKKGYIDEIVGILRHEERGYSIDLATGGSVHLDAQGSARVVSSPFARPLSKTLRILTANARR